jgi:large subunit ribosomal protein L34
VGSALVFGEFAMHYPHRISRIKRKRSIGFRARMKTKHGRAMMNRKRAAGRSLNIADK